MQKTSYKRHRFHSSVIQQAVWLYFKFSLSYRDVECLMAQRGIEVSYETIRCWIYKFGPQYAAHIRRSRRMVSKNWHLDKVFVCMGKRRYYLWRAVDDEGEVLDVLVQKRRNKKAALRLIRRLLKNLDTHPKTIVTDRLWSYGAALKDLGIKKLHVMGGRPNNRVENSHLPIPKQERKIQRFKSKKSAQIFLSIHAPIYNLFNIQQHLVSRAIMKSLRIAAFKN